MASAFDQLANRNMTTLLGDLRRNRCISKLAHGAAPFALWDPRLRFNPISGVASGEARVISASSARNRPGFLVRLLAAPRSG